VLKEANIDSTLNVLRLELSNYRKQLNHESGDLQRQQEEVGQTLMNVMNKSNQNSLMLYSQKSQYVFDLTYACHAATEQYHQFKKNSLPFRSLYENNQQEIARYDSLINNLSQMYTGSLSERGKIDRNVCLTLAINIRRTLKSNSEQLKSYINYYTMTERQLKNLDDYANKRYADIQENIFSNSGNNYFVTISRLHNMLHDTKSIIKDKYLTNSKAKSQWSFKYIFWLFAALFIYGCLAGLLNYCALHWLIPRKLRTKKFIAKRTCITMATSAVTLAIILEILKLVTKQNFFIMASGILVEFTWLLSVILISLLLRLDSDQIKSAFRIYSPLIVMGFIIIAFRVVLIPNQLVNLFLPPLLLIAMLWQWNAISRLQSNLPKSDKFFTYITLGVFTFSVICSWVGYTLLAVQILIWWVMQLTCTLTITCASGWLLTYSRRHDLSTKPITQTWFFNFILNALLPILSVYSFILSIYWATDVFNLSDVTWSIFNKNFIDSKNFTVSLFSLAMVLTLYFIFKYINATLLALLQLHFSNSGQAGAASKSIMAKNVIQVFIWGIWFITTLNIFHVSNTWIVVVSGGLSTGIGFAMKDILENIYYGISLMAGRVKIGDYIVVDNIRGRVASISYTSTLVEAIDGSIIAFQNSQLFTKNYKNMTKNHGYELDILEVGVAYGTNIKQVQKLLEDAILQLDCINKKRPPHVVLKSFDDSSINLKILVWVPVLTQYYDDGKILECVYDTLNKNNIQIPFPQREVRILHGTEEEEAESEQLDKVVKS
jgi:small-conductance mechanosensitive channel